MNSPLRSLRLRMYLALTAAITLGSIAGHAQVYERMFSFTEALEGTPNLGSSAIGDLVSDGNGNFYGTTQRGGVFGNGTIYKITPGGDLTTLIDFTDSSGPNKGQEPHPGLIRGSDGNFYGTTREGGASHQGTIFKMTPAGALTTLVELTSAGPRSPTAGLAEGSDGDFYGMTASHPTGHGAVFKMTPAGVLTTLVEFTGTSGPNLGRNLQVGFNSKPQARLVQDPGGDFYGMTPEGGASDHGTIFRMTPAGVLTTLVEFTGTAGSDPGSHPQAGLLRYSDGNYYGTTEKGGAFDHGTIFKVSPTGTLTTLVEFTSNGPSNKGSQPNSSLTLGSGGDFYGTTSSGGSSTPYGTVFKMTPAGVLTTLAEFTFNGSTDLGGIRPSSGVTTGPDGNFYGTTVGGGQFGHGTVYRMTPTGELTTLADFSGRGSIGAAPYSGLIQDTDGNFYGTTPYGGPNQFGTVYKMTPGGDLTTFAALGKGGRIPYPYGRLLKDDSDGNFYTTTFGAIVKITPTGAVTELLDFDGTVGPNLGSQLYSGLIKGLDGYFYGTTGVGGVPNKGTIFKFTTDGTRDGTALTTLVEFSDDGPTNKGSFPSTSLVLGSDGSFYGTTRGGGSLDFGTVFKMSAAGILTTLVEFSGNGATNKGASPYGVLVEGDDGSFFGTTSRGGTYGDGTVFKVTPGGVLTTLVEFEYDGPTNKGRYPLAGLLKDANGNYYGTTQFGGSSGGGTVFRMTPAGVLDTIFEFTDSEYGTPNYGELIRGTDGNLYGAKSESTGTSGGSVYRLIFDGPPLVANAPALPPGSTTAVVQAQVNARGSSTVVTLEYWTGSETPPEPVLDIAPIATDLNGYQTQLVGTTLTGLAQGTTYYYRFRAVSDAGMMTGPVATFSPVQSTTTLAAPVVIGLAATEILSTSAVLNGTVNARNFESSVLIEWGTDGNSFPNTVAANPPIVTGNSPVDVNFALGNQQPGITFFYRVVATNAGGTSTSGTQSYRTLTPATARVTGATALSTTRAQVTGFVDPKGSNASVSFEYGTDGVNFPKSFTASPASVSGELETEVTATLTGLTQGTNYIFRIKADGPGGVGFSETSTISLSILSGLQQVFPDPPPTADGTVTVNFTPMTTGAWRFTGDSEWRNSGVAAGNLATGKRTIEFIPIPGFIRPPSEEVDVTASGNIVLDRIYFDTTSTGSGALTVRLKPDVLADQGVAEANRIQWRVVGETAWRNSGDQLGALATGSYLVECKPVTGRETPPTTSVSIGTDDSQDFTLTYFTANTTGGLPPLPQTFSDVSTNEDQPFAYIGQIKSEVGSSTGFVVKRRVVATAGHVVFDDGTLSAVTDLQWFFQRHTDVHEPKPQIPRGYYLAAGYDTQRITDLTPDDQGNTPSSPGEGSAQSQNLDYAALYFTEEAGRGGYGGFLASDSGDDNEFLDSASDKFLAGYPVDGIPVADEGKLHATASFTSAMTPAFGETWTTTAVKGLGGISGGPLFVRFENGPFLPAAIYLGGAGQTVVRAIDSDVVELFLRAEVSGNGGDNNTGGGITHTSVAGSLNATVPGSLKVIIEPASANAIGAAWQLNPETTFRQGGSQKSGLSAGTYNLTFTTVAGFDAPVAQQVSVSGGLLTTVTFTYQEEVTATPLETWRFDNFQTTSNTGEAADGEDPDKDGVKNIDEFTAGTDPKSATDVFKMGNAVKIGNAFTAGCIGKAGRLYILQRNTSLSGMWMPVATQGPLESDGPVSLTDTSAPAGSSYYRIQVTAP